MDSEVFIYTAAAIVLMLIFWAVGSIQCSAHWSKSGLRSNWGPIQGCMVEVTPNRWLPEDSLRDMTLGGRP